MDLLAFKNFPPMVSCFSGGRMMAFECVRICVKMTRGCPDRHVKRPQNPNTAAARLADGAKTTAEEEVADEAPDVRRERG